MKFNFWLIAFILNFNLLFAQLKYVSNDTSSFLKIMLVGDVNLNEQVLRSSYSENRKQYDFQYLFHYIRPVLNLADVVVGNSENTFGAQSNYLKDDMKYAPNEFGVALKYAGFNLLMNANKTGVYQELDQWKQNSEYLKSININQLGSFEHEADRYRRNPTIIEKHGLKVAFLNYYYGLAYYPELSPLINGFQEDVVERDIILAKNRGADYVIVYMNWGTEYQLSANQSQKDAANFCFNSGANMVVGSHPHVVQGANVKTLYLNKQESSQIVTYSLGDFISTTSDPLNNGACIIELILEKSKQSNLTSIADLSFIPTYTAMYEENEKVRYAIMPVSQVEKNNINVPISNIEKQWMRSAAEKVRYNFKGQIDEIEYELSDDIVDDVAEFLTITRRPMNEDRDFALGINNHLLLALSGFLDEKSDISSAPITYPGIIYKIQFLSLRREIPIDLEFYKHLKGYEVYFEDEYFHYVIGNYRNLKQANDFCLDVKRNGHKYAYVVAFENGVKKK